MKRKAPTRDPYRETRNGLFDKMMLADGPTMNFRIEREPTDGRTFSKDAMVDLTDSMAMWVGTRLVKSMPKAGTLGPGRMTVRVEVAVEGHHFHDDLEPDYTITAGSHRKAGERVH